jgi:alkylhydroperoxidase/carboxymuconolactone decarboxylase family protein YurZ
MSQSGPAEPAVTSDRSRDQLLSDVASLRGYVLPMHEVLADWDPTFLSAYEGLAAASLGARDLDRRTKEIVYVGVLTAVGTSPEHLRAHLLAAIAHGATERELLQVLELVLMPAGVPRFVAAIDVFSGVFGHAPAHAVRDAHAD